MGLLAGSVLLIFVGLKIFMPVGGIVIYVPAFASSYVACRLIGTRGWLFGSAMGLLWAIAYMLSSVDLRNTVGEAAMGKFGISISGLMPIALANIPVGAIAGYIGERGSQGATNTTQLQCGLASRGFEGDPPASGHPSGPPIRSRDSNPIAQAEDANRAA